jgi:hypothetical protein
MPRKSILLAAMGLIGSTLIADAQPFYYQPYAPYQAPQTPPSWSYDPYTSGAAPCPQGARGDLLKCEQKMPPTYGQPSYWPQR